MRGFDLYVCLYYVYCLCVGVHGFVLACILACVQRGPYVCMCNFITSTTSVLDML